MRRWLKRDHPDFYRARYRKGVDYWRAVYEPKMDRACSIALRMRTLYADLGTA